MQVVNRKDEPIHSLEEWKTRGKPASDKHWSEGRSAYELAADWIEGDAPTRVKELLGLREDLADVELLKGIAEKQTRFDDVKGGVRNHDLLVLGENSHGPVVIGVEGKADEPFDKPLWRWRDELMRKNPRSGAKLRLDQLTTHFFDATIDQDPGYPALGCLGYQLLSALAGTLADTKESSAERSVVLIHEFKTPKTSPERQAVNAQVLEDFLNRISKGEIEQAGDESSWISTPVPVRGDGEWMPLSTPVYFGKLISERPGSR